MALAGTLRWLRAVFAPTAKGPGPVMSQSATRDYDAIVIGSGMTGGYAAKELTELGLRTLVLEAGRPIVPAEDYSEHRPVWEMPFRGRGDRQYVQKRQAMQRNSVSFDEGSHQFW